MIFVIEKKSIQRVELIFLEFSGKSVERNVGSTLKNPIGGGSFKKSKSM